MQWLLEQWRQNYDYVLVDTSALSGLADAQSLTTKVDEVLFVVRLQGPEKETVTEALETLKINQARIAGTVVTKMSRRTGTSKNQEYNPFST
jgi:Mrp family chromosome partitioning ATPase